MGMRCPRCRLVLGPRDWVEEQLAVEGGERGPARPDRAAVDHGVLAEVRQMTPRRPGLQPDLRSAPVGPLKSVGRSHPEDLSEALALLRRGVAALDRLCYEAGVSEAKSSLAMAPGEASQGGHRALMALSNQLTDGRPADLVARPSRCHG